ncbi:hypothetical protein J5J86_13510 [Aquabacter sp. L1I39]|uniref:hypothetical protein n=1 Tax=Aquabacter sp. L1I39 TaxID=2820278 RepID=UPI001ADBD527|nr:hypothetical protein [Aquabacter sp. L1I39]QTL01825.1 hypothetical protein J5J86_13510 [Aquabacter sp. L1I39]
MRKGAALLTLALAVCWPGWQSPKRCAALKALVDAAQASGVAQADEAGWYGPPGTLVRIAAPEEPFLPVTFPKAEAPVAPPVTKGMAPRPVPTSSSSGLSRALLLAPAFSPYFSPTASSALRSAVDVQRRLEGWGFTGVSDLEMRGTSYLCEATGPRRERVRLVLDAHTGDISGMEVIGFEDMRY